MVIFGTREGENLDKYKIGNEFNTDPHLMLSIFKNLFPTKQKKILHAFPCFYMNTKDQEFIFKRVNNTIYATGDNGRAFKHIGYHGKRIYHLVMGNYQ